VDKESTISVYDNAIRKGSIVVYGTEAARVKEFISHLPLLSGSAPFAPETTPTATPAARAALPHAEKPAAVPPLAGATGEFPTVLPEVVVSPPGPRPAPVDPPLTGSSVPTIVYRTAPAPATAPPYAAAARPAAAATTPPVPLTAAQQTAKNASDAAALTAANAAEAARVTAANAKRDADAVAAQAAADAWAVAHPNG
jgi:hypothetical protein